MGVVHLQSSESHIRVDIAVRAGADGRTVVAAAGVDWLLLGLAGAQVETLTVGGHLVRHQVDPGARRPHQRPVGTGHLPALPAGRSARAALIAR